MKKLAISLGTLCVSLVLLATVSYAWFANATRYTDMEFTFGSVKVIATLERGIDFNRDGYLDKDTTTGALDQYTTFGGTIGSIVGTWAPSQMLPSQLFTYKVIVKNTGEMKGGTAEVSIGGVQPALANVLVARYAVGRVAPQSDSAVWTAAVLSDTTLKLGSIAIPEGTGDTVSFVFQIGIYKVNASQADYAAAKDQSKNLQLVVSVAI